MSTDAQPLLQVQNLVKHFGGSGGKPAIKAVNDLSLSIRPGETVGLVGESGCGKSTTGRCIIGLDRPTSGTVTFNGQSVNAGDRRGMRKLWRDMQYVFQDPFASLNPLMTVHAILAEPLQLSGMKTAETRARVSELLHLVGLAPEHGNRFPHEFSGGQRQRIGIARALALNPRLLILDEPVSALDVSIQAQVINLLEDLQDRLGLAYLFIAHDLSVVSHICDRVAVMYLGKIVELGSREQIFTRPQHPYTQALLSAVPIDDPDLRGTRQRIVLQGDPPSPANPPSGCTFRTRCWKARQTCAELVPVLESRTIDGQAVACHFPEIHPDADAIPAGRPHHTADRPAPAA